MFPFSLGVSGIVIIYRGYTAANTDVLKPSVRLDDLRIEFNHLPNGGYVMVLENNEFQTFTISFQIFK